MARILIAEDEEALRALTARALTDSGHEVVTAVDGADALDIITRQGGRFELLRVVVDVDQPRRPLAARLAPLDLENVVAARPDKQHVLRQHLEKDGRAGGRSRRALNLEFSRG